MKHGNRKVGFRGPNASKTAKIFPCLMHSPHEIQLYDCRFSISRLETHKIIKLGIFLKVLKSFNRFQLYDFVFLAAGNAQN